MQRNENRRTDDIKDRLFRIICSKTLIWRHMFFEHEANVQLKQRKTRKAQLLTQRDVCRAAFKRLPFAACWSPRPANICLWNVWIHVMSCPLFETFSWLSETCFRICRRVLPPGSSCTQIQSSAASAPQKVSRLSVFSDFMCSKCFELSLSRSTH